MFNLLNNLPKNFVNSPFAHRGYHDCNGSFKEGKGPENSRRSIIHAIKNGLGVEIDDLFSKRNGKVTGEVTHKKSIFSIFDKQPSSGKVIIDKKNIQCKLPYGISLIMHVVGEKERREIPWSQINNLDISKPPAKWNK